MITQEYLNNLWRWKCGLSEPRAPEGCPGPEFLERIQLHPGFERLLPEHPFSEELRRLRTNRVVMGYFRYGDNRRTSLAATNYCDEAIRRIRRYSETLELEYVVDALNILMLEWIGAELRGKVLKEPRPIKEMSRRVMEDYLSEGKRTDWEFRMDIDVLISLISKFKYRDDMVPLAVASVWLSAEYLQRRLEGTTVRGVDDGHTFRYE